MYVTEWPEEGVTFRFMYYRKQAHAKVLFDFGPENLQYHDALPVDCCCNHDVMTVHRTGHQLHFQF